MLNILPMFEGKGVEWKGLGSSPSHDDDIVEGIARAGNGAAHFASIAEELGDKEMDQLRDALHHPAWTGNLLF